MADNEDIFTFTAPGRLIFPTVTPSQLAEATKYYDEQVKKGNKRLRAPGWEVSLMLPMNHPDLPAIDAIIGRLIADNQPNEDVNGNPIGGAAEPLKSGDALANKRKAAIAKLSPPKEPDREYLRGNLLLVARSKFPPALAAVINGVMTDLVTTAQQDAASRMFFMGAEALIQVRFAWYEPTALAANGGVNAFLNMVAVTGKGEPLGQAQRSATSVFKGYAGQVTNADPTRRATRRTFDERNPPPADGQF